MKHLSEMNVQEVEKEVEMITRKVIAIIMVQGDRAHRKTLQADVRYKNWTFIRNTLHPFRIPEHIIHGQPSAMTRYPRSKLLQLPNEILIQIIANVHPLEEYGRVGLALTCKKLAQFTTQKIIPKTAQAMSFLQLLEADQGWCVLCGRGRTRDVQYWLDTKEVWFDCYKGTAADVEQGMDEHGIMRRRWAAVWDGVIKGWGLVQNHCIKDESAIWCPPCHSQDDWEQRLTRVAFLRNNLSMAFTMHLIRLTRRLSKLHEEKEMVSQQAILEEQGKQDDDIHDAETGETATPDDNMEGVGLE